MSSKKLSLSSGYLSMSLGGGGVSVTVNAMDTLKEIGELYGLYSSWETERDRRVMYEEQPVPALVVQEDISYHGSPYWQTMLTLTTDPVRIKQYHAFAEILKFVEQVEREKDKTPPSAATPDNSHLKKKGRSTYER